MVYRTRDEMLKVLGENLRASRLADNLSQQTAAERSGISLKAIRNLEAGENASTLSLLSYCRTLRKTDWLMTLAPPEINDAMFERRFAQKGRRQRAGRTPREATHG
jgi:transcriptional regulator with XRE-family HTH domain